MYTYTYIYTYIHIHIHMYTHTKEYGNLQVYVHDVQKTLIDTYN